MKSTFGIGFLLAVLVSDASSADYTSNFFNVPKTKRNSPYNFGYYKTSDGLLMEITVKNVPPSVTAVTATQFRYDGSWQYNKPPQMDTFEVNVDKKTREGKLLILPSLNIDQVWVVVQLHNVGGLCNETKIIEGRDKTAEYSYYWDTSKSRRVYYEYSDWEHDADRTCLAPEACKLILDLKNTCKEQPKSTYGENVECQIKESQYICTFVRAANNYNELLLSQNYEDDSVIGPLWEIENGKITTTLSIQLELFDNNTSVKLAPQWSKTITTLWSDTLSITAQNISKTSDVTILKYTDITDVEFSCKQYEQRLTKIHVGFINTTDNKIKTHNTIIMKRKKFTMADNGTILCCIVYESKKNWQINQYSYNITRFVKNKTLLIYQTQTESNEQRKVPCQDVWWLYLLLTLLGTAVLLLTLYIVKKQHCCTKSQPAEETVELDNYATTNQVLYANLDFVNNESRGENQIEESPYANIIGVLHPL